MKKKLSIVGMSVGVALIFVGILTLTGALGGEPSYPSFATPPYDAGYALFSSDYSTYSVNNSAEAASGARAAAYTIAHVAEFLTTFFGIMSILFGLAVGGCSGIVFVSSGTASEAAASSAPAANKINYKFSAFETAERARKETVERARKEAAERTRKETVEKAQKETTEKIELPKKPIDVKSEKKDNTYYKFKVMFDEDPISKCDSCGNKETKGACCRIDDDNGTKYVHLCTDCISKYE